MKCRNCNNEAIYPDGLCETCHQAASQDAKVMSSEEGDSFHGQTINEDGTVYDKSQSLDREGGEEVHVYFKKGLPLRIKLAIGFIIFVAALIVVSALGLLLLALPYLLGAAVIYIVFNIVRSFIQ